MKKFLFITPLTPKQLLNDVRRDLFELYKSSLTHQTYTGWSALLLGEEEGKEGNFHYIKCPSQGKNDKLRFVADLIVRMRPQPDFIIRIDDDDVMRPDVLSEVAQLDFDCYGDRWHAFYDVVSGRTSLQERPWLANTIIHKTEHALAPYGDSGDPLFVHNHFQAWHPYYEGKKVVYADQFSPVYLRLLSPTTYSHNKKNARYSGQLEYDKQEYRKFLKKFGKFNDTMPAGFNIFGSELSVMKARYYGEEPSGSWFSRLFKTSK
jgi:hypothetical protein